MNQHTSLTAYHARRRAEVELELERLRHAPIVRRVPAELSNPFESCERRHVGPGTAVLIGLGALVVIGALLGSSRD